MRLPFALSASAWMRDPGGATALVAEGMRMEFPVSVPLPRRARLAVTAVTVPPDDPPGEKRTS